MGISIFGRVEMAKRYAENLPDATENTLDETADPTPATSTAPKDPDRPMLFQVNCQCKPHVRFTLTSGGG